MTMLFLLKFSMVRFSNKLVPYRFICIDVFIHNKVFFSFLLLISFFFGGGRRIKKVLWDELAGIMRWW
jgi:hypothetical protein